MKTKQNYTIIILIIKIVLIIQFLSIIDAR